MFKAITLTFIGKTAEQDIHVTLCSGHNSYASARQEALHLIANMKYPKTRKIAQNNLRIIRE